MNRTVVSLVAWFVASQAHAEVRLAPIFSDGMVLQRDVPCAIAGTAAPNEAVEVRFHGESARATADSKGGFIAMLPALLADAKEDDLVVSAPSGSMTIHRVLVGDVWLCAGQSNMEWPMAAFSDMQESIARADRANVRLLRMRIAGEGDRTFDADRPDGIEANVERGLFTGSWEVASAASAKSFSAVAFSFALRLKELLPAIDDVPIGLVQNAIGGSPAEAWMQREDLKSDPSTAPLLSNWLECDLVFPWCRDEGRAAAASFEKTCAEADAAGRPRPKRQRHRFEPTALFDGGIAPLAPFRFKGVLWYQGESNAHRPDLYATMMPKLIARFRATLLDAELPFLFVQLAGYGKGENWMELREAQATIAKTIPRTGMAVAIDIGDENDIHPAHKGEVGRRLALLAIERVYGDVPVKRKVVVIDGRPIVSAKVAFQDATGPTFVASKTLGAAIEIRLANAKSLHPSVEGRSLTGFEVAGDDGVFHPAVAKIEYSPMEPPGLDDEPKDPLARLSLTSDAVSHPTRARYAWAPNPKVNLVNALDLPLAPFRTRP